MTFIGVLCACARRAELFLEAEEIFRQIPEADEDVSSESLLWATLLSACRFREGVAVGERIL